MSDSQILSELKNYQNKIRINNICMAVVYIAIPIGFFMALMDYVNGKNFIISLVVAIAGCIVVGPLGKNGARLKKVKKDFIGEHIIKSLLAEKIEIKQYTPSNFISKDIIKGSSIMPSYDRISGSDYISGTYKGVNISYSDIVLQRIETYRDSNGRRRTRHVTVFKGHFFRMYLGNKIDGYVRIVERKNPRKKGFFADLLGSAADLVGMKSNTIELENEAFNNQFEVKTDNDQLAFYILTPHFMESVIRADELADGYTNMLFKDNRVDIAMNNYVDSFEVKRNIYTQNALDECRMLMRKDLDILLAIADEILAKDRLFNA